MINELRNPKYQRKGDLMEIMIDVVEEKIQSALNSGGEIRYLSEAIKKQDGNGRGNKGKRPDRIEFVLYDDGSRRCYVPRVEEDKNYGRYKLKRGPFKAKIADKFRGFEDYDKVVCGSLNVNPEWMKEIHTACIDVGKDIQPDATIEEIQEYEDQLLGRKLIDLAIKSPNILGGQASNREVHIVDKYRFQLWKDGKVEYEFDLKKIKPDTFVWIGPKLADLFRWCEYEGEVRLFLPWKHYSWYEDDMEVKIGGTISSSIFYGLHWKKSNN